MSATGDAWALLSARVEAILKTLSLTSVGLYAVGLLVMNTYLAKYGITDFAALKPQCFLTGAWTLMLLAVASLPAVAFVQAVSDKKTLWFKRYATATILLGALAYLSTLIAAGIFDLIGSVSFGAQSIMRLDPGVPGWRYLLVTMLFPCLMRIRPNDITRDSPGRDWLLKALPLFVIAAIFGIFVMGYEIYESVNPEFGGGRPLEAGLYFSDDGKDLLNDLRHTARPFHDNDPPRTIAGELIYAASDRYVFRILYCRGPLEGQWTADTIKRMEERVVIEKKVVQALLVGDVAKPAESDKCPADITHFTRESVTPN
jgi:hypothetical protein